MAIPREFIDELKARASLKEVVEKRVKLVRKGRDYWGCCPFHTEKTPSFKVDGSDEFYKCFGCEAHGNIFDFIINTEGVSFPEAVERLAGQMGMDVPADSPKERQRLERRKTISDVLETTTRWFQDVLHGPEGRAALLYLKSRNVDDALIERYRLGFSPGRKGALKTAMLRHGISEQQLIDAGLYSQTDNPQEQPYMRFRERIIFPISDRRGHVIAFGGRLLGKGAPKYLNSPETILYHKGRHLYGLDLASFAAREADRLLVVEGYMDAIALAGRGFDYTVASLGTALTEEQIRTLWRVVRTPILCYDGDQAGQKAAFRAAERLLPLSRPGYSMRFILLPEKEDPDSLIQTQGEKAMENLVRQALPLSEFLWRYESALSSLDTPEARAHLQKRLENHALAIVDPVLRAHYLRDFRNRIWQTSSASSQPKSKNNTWYGDRYGNRGKTQDHPVGRELNRRTKFDAVMHAHRTRVIILVRHPVLFEQLEEDFASIEVPDAALDRLRRAIIEILSVGTETYDSLVRRLEQDGFGEILENLHSDTLLKSCIRLEGDDIKTSRPLRIWETETWHIRRCQTQEEKKQEAPLADSALDEEYLKRKKAFAHQCLMLAEELKNS